MLLDSLENDEEEPSPYKAPRVPMAAAIEQAANIVDRFNRIFMRALRQLRDLRRFTSQVIVKSASQVNVGNAHVNFDDGRPNGFGATGYVVDCAKDNRGEAS